MKLNFPALFLIVGLSSSGAMLRAQMPPGPAQAAPGQVASSPPPPAATASAQPTSAPPPAADSSSKAAPKTYIVPSGTKLPLILHNSVTTRNAKPGDPVYLETLFPVVIDNRILIPAGSYVQGEITDAKRPGRGKGVGEIRVRLNSMILPNGYTVDFNAIPTNAGTGGNESVDSEGNIHGDSDKGEKVGTVMKSTGIGAGVGGIASGSAGGAGIGAIAGAGVGLAMVMLTRGPELELPRGTTVDVALDRAVYLDASRINFTDPGHASSLPGPPSREPTRNHLPI